METIFCRRNVKLECCSIYSFPAKKGQRLLPFLCLSGKPSHEDFLRIHNFLPVECLFGIRPTDPYNRNDYADCRVL